MIDEYLLTWLRPAKSKGYVVLAPQSLGRTWAIQNPDRDLLSIVTMLNRIREEYAIDPDRILVTGLSDGGTFAYALSSSHLNLSGRVAPIADLLPLWFDVKKAKALPILIIHGAQDFLFPVMVARLAQASLIRNGFAEVTSYLIGLTRIHIRLTKSWCCRGLRLCFSELLAIPPPA